MGFLSKTTSHILPLIPKSLVNQFSKSYIAGETLDDAINTVRTMMGEGASTTLDVLGEEIHSQEQAYQAVKLYKDALSRINADRLDAGISVKPTHMGLKIDPQICYQNIRTLVELAKSLDLFVRIDMEDHTTTQATLDIYRQLREDFDNVGVVLQTYLRRTITDIKQLLPLRPNLRICKGIYREPRQVAYHDKEIINSNFSYALEQLFKNDCFVGIATHDERVVWDAMYLIDKYNVDKANYEFQMLLGVDPLLRKIIIQNGHRLRVYIPFGAEWLAYSQRRLKENPDIIGHVLKNFTRRIRFND